MSRDPLVRVVAALLAALTIAAAITSMSSTFVVACGLAAIAVALIA